MLAGSELVLARGRLATTFICWWTVFAQNQSPFWESAHDEDGRESVVLWRNGFLGYRSRYILVARLIQGKDETVNIGRELAGISPSKWWSLTNSGPVLPCPGIWWCPEQLRHHCHSLIQIDRIEWLTFNGRRPTVVGYTQRRTNESKWKEGQEIT